MQKLPHLVPALSHHLKPRLRDDSQFTSMLFHPAIDGRITLGGTFNRNNSVLVVMTFLERLPIPGGHAFLIFHGIAETFGLNAELT